MKKITISFFLDFRIIMRFNHVWRKQTLRYNFFKHLYKFSSTFQGILFFFQANYQFKHFSSTRVKIQALFQSVRTLMSEGHKSQDHSLPLEHLSEKIHHSGSQIDYCEPFKCGEMFLPLPGNIKRTEGLERLARCAVDIGRQHVD